MFITRLLSGIVLLAVALVTIISGGWVLFVTLLAVSLIGMRELYRAAGVTEGKWNLLECAGYAGAVLYYLSLLLTEEEIHLSAVLVGLVLIMCVYVFTYPRYQAEQVMAAFFGIAYVAVMLSFLYQTRQMEGRSISGMVDYALLLGL